MTSPDLPPHLPPFGGQPPPYPGEPPAAADGRSAAPTADQGGWAAGIMRRLAAMASGALRGGPAISSVALADAARPARTPGFPTVPATYAHYRGVVRAAGAPLVIDHAARPAYLDLLRTMWRADQGATAIERQHLYSRVQSVLHQLARAEAASARFTAKPVFRSLDRLDKATFSPLIAQAIGHRPAAIVFDLADFRSAIPTLERMLDRGAVYLKANQGFRGEQVVRMVRCEGGVNVRDALGRNRTFPRLAWYRPQPSDRPSMNVFIAEEEIPIARTRSGQTWEMRMLPPFGAECAYVKLGPAGSVVNNVAQGGRSLSAERVLRSVIRARYPQASDEEIAQRVARFMARAADLSDRVKALSDEVQVQSACAILQPGDFKRPTDYEWMMRAFFSGTFLCVDITGMWDAQGELFPVVIEAQTSAALPDTLGPVAYTNCLGVLNDKIDRLRAALRYA